jgi:hypothetical protein
MTTSYVVELPLEVRKENVVDYHLQPPFRTSVKIQVEAESEEEAGHLVALFLVGALEDARTTPVFKVPSGVA